MHNNQTNQTLDILNQYQQASSGNSLQNRIKVSDFNLHDVVGTALKSLDVVQSYQENQEATKAFSEIQKDLVGPMKTHLRVLEDQFLEAYASGGGACQWVKQTVKLMSSKTPGGYVYITPGDGDVEYMYFMLAIMAGKKKLLFNLPTKDLYLTLGTAAENHPYTEANVFKSFKYIVKGGDTSPFSSSSEGRQMIPNSHAKGLYDLETEEAKKIVKVVFDKHIEHCNVLKDQTTSVSNIVCEKSYSSANPEFLMLTSLCHQIIMLAQDPELCQPIGEYSYVFSTGVINDL